MLSLMLLIWLASLHLRELPATEPRGPPTRRALIRPMPKTCDPRGKGPRLGRTGKA